MVIRWKESCYFGYLNNDFFVRIIDKNLFRIDLMFFVNCSQLNVMLCLCFMVEFVISDWMVGIIIVNLILLSVWEMVICNLYKYKI